MHFTGAPPAGPLGIHVFRRHTDWGDQTTYFEIETCLVQGSCAVVVHRQLHQQARSSIVSEWLESKGTRDRVNDPNTQPAKLTPSFVVRATKYRHSESPVKRMATE